jgi:hypothetical protein
MQNFKRYVFILYLKDEYTHRYQYVLSVHILDNDNGQIMKPMAFAQILDFIYTLKDMYVIYI